MYIAFNYAVVDEYRMNMMGMSRGLVPTKAIRLTSEILGMLLWSAFC